MFKSQLLLCFRMGLFPIYLLTEENMVELRKKIKRTFSIYIS